MKKPTNDSALSGTSRSTRASSNWPRSTRGMRPVAIADASGSLRSTTRLRSPVAGSA
jgi:hypothetical protein